MCQEKCRGTTFKCTWKYDFRLSCLSDSVLTATLKCYVLLQDKEPHSTSEYDKRKKPQGKQNFQLSDIVG